MAINFNQIDITLHSYIRLRDHKIINPAAPIAQIKEIIWNYLLQSREIITQSTIYYQFGQMEFRFDHEGILITHIEQI